MAESTVVVLGGGIGGVSVVLYLRKLLGRGHRLVLVNKDEKHLYLPSLLWVMMGRRRPMDISRDLSVLERQGIDTITGTVERIDAAGKSVVVNNERLAYDYLVLAPGADLAPDKIPGLAAGAHTFYSLDGALRLNESLEEFRSGRLAMVISSLPYKCPAAPFEAAMLLDEHFRRRGLRQRVSLEVYLPEPLPMPVAGPKVGKAILELLRAREIAFSPNHKLASVDGKAGKLLFEDQGRRDYDLLVAVPPHVAPAVIETSGLAGPQGWVPTNPQTLETSLPNVFAIGDVAAIKLPSGKMLPKAGVFAHAEAKIVAANIAAEVASKPAASRFDGAGSCFVEVGSGRAGLATGNFYADPEPVVNLRSPWPWWRWLKVANERRWLRWFR